MYEFLMDTENAGRLMVVCLQMFPIQTISLAVIIFAIGYIFGGAFKADREED